MAAQLLERLLAGQRQPQRVGSTAGAVFFIARGAERGAHGAALQFAAHSRAVAQFDRAHEAFLALVVENGGRLKRGVTGREAQVFGHGGSAHHLAGIEQIMRVKGLLDLPEGLVDDRPEHFAIPLAARQAVAMFAAQRAAKLEHQIGDLGGDLPHALHVGGCLQVQERPDVQAADAGMAVKGALGAVPLENSAETAHELGQPGRRDRGILHERHRLAIAAHAVQQGHR